jgi:hypothetical protein
MIPAPNVSTRVKDLIERHDGGDWTMAARRLGIEPDRLAGLLSGDWRQFSLDALTALVRGYSISLDSLLAPPAVSAAVRPPDSVSDTEGKTWQ